ncbi:MAG: hypothetical protein Q4G69_13545 [Planctomycetia bacterium]|nr:hypothetical protein [Planctomycetia bacterium]
MMKSQVRYCFLSILILFGISAALSAETVKIDSIPTIDWQFNGGKFDLIDTNPFVYGTLGTTSFDMQWAGSTYRSWHATRCRVGKDWQTAAHHLASIRTFTAPRSGKIQIKGSAARLKTDSNADPLLLIVRVNDRDLISGSLDSLQGAPFSYSKDLDVKKGDRIRFILQKKSTNYPNEVHNLVWSSKENPEAMTLRWDPEIQYLDGNKESFQASKAFFTKPEDKPIQDPKPWSYEYQQIGNTNTLLPKDYDTNFGRMIQFEWIREDKIEPGSAPSFRKAAQLHLEHAQKLLIELADELDEAECAKIKSELAKLKFDLDKIPSADVRANEWIYARIRGIKRTIILSNPLLDFGSLLFCKRVPSSYSHLVAQYLGWRARSGGSLFVLKEPGKSLECIDLIKNRLPKGSILEPRLSWDGKKVVFSFVDLKDGITFDPQYVHYTDPDQAYYHIYSMNIDGSDLKQLTKGEFDDITPNWLPDGDIVFSSTRRLGYARCYWWGFGKRWNVYTIFRMKPDGSGIKQLSWHETNEWFPEVNANGLITYARWDYIDRDAVTHQNLWAMRPDGTNPLAVWGNASPNPMCTFQAVPIPNSKKYVFTSSAHHSITGGSPAILDPSAGVDGLQSIQSITPDLGFPESEKKMLPEFYESPYPLSDRFFLISYSPYPLRWEPQEPNLINGQGIYLLDIYGNRELIYRDSKIGSTSPIPIQERPTPPVLASQLPKDPPPFGEMSITDIYQGLGSKIERGRIKNIRIVQILPKTTRDSDYPPIGLAGEENARLILGSVPVEADGSAYFRVPAQTPILLQVLDEKGFAYQTMRSLTYLQPGEHVSCTGCHENRVSSAYASSGGSTNTGTIRPKAMLRPASIPDPGKLGGRTFSYVETVQPIWDRHCLECHNNTRSDGKINLTGDPDRMFSKSYYALCRNKEFWGDNGRDPKRLEHALVPRFGGRNTIQMTEPGGKYGAIGSRLIKLLQNGHEGVKLSDEEIRTIAVWIDLNAVFYGVYEAEDQARQLRGEKVPIPKIQ